MLQRRKDVQKSRKLKNRQGSCQKGVHFKILTIIPLTLLQRSSFPVWVFPSTEGNHLYVYTYLYIYISAIAGSSESMSWPNTPSPTCNKSSARNPRSFTKTKSSWDSWTSNHTVDGRNPVGSLSHYLQGSIHYRWLAGFLPSTAAWIFLFPAQVLCETAVCLQLNAAIILKLTNNTSSKPHAWGSFFLGGFPA